MKRKISFTVIVLINILCAFMQVWMSTGAYCGIEFDLNYGIMIFCTLEFISLSLLMKNRDDCLFFDNNLIKLVRIASRRRAMTFEILKITAATVMIEAVKIIFTALFSVILSKDITIGGILLLFAFELLVKLLLMLIQFALEITAAYNFSFLAVCIVFLLLLLFGSAAYTFVTEHPDAAITPVLRFINKFNLINYISPYRAKRLCSSTGYPIAATAALNILQAIILIYNSKRLNILPKE